MAKFKDPQKLLTRIRDGGIKLGDSVAIFGYFGEMEVGTGSPTFAMTTVTVDGLRWGARHLSLTASQVVAWCPVAKGWPKKPPSKKFKPVAGDTFTAAIIAAGLRESRANWN